MDKLKATMLLYDSDNFPLVVVHFQPSSWEKDAYNAFIAAIEGLLVRGAQEQQPISLLVKGSRHEQLQKQYIPTVLYGWLIYDIVRLRPLFEYGLHRSAIFTPDDHLNFFFEMLFKVYTPTRPLQLFDDYEAAQTWVSADR